MNELSRILNRPEDNEYFNGVPEEDETDERAREAYS